MEIDKKKYQILKTKKQIKINKVLYFFNGTNQKSKKWLVIEQEIKFSGFYNQKVSKNITKNLFNQSIYKKIYPIINGATFMIKPIKNSQHFEKNIISNNFSFIAIGLKLTNKIYPNKLIKNLKTIEYKENFLLLHQFFCLNLKNKINSK